MGGDYYGKGWNHAGKGEDWSTGGTPRAPNDVAHTLGLLTTELDPKLGGCGWVHATAPRTLPPAMAIGEGGKRRWNVRGVSVQRSWAGSPCDT